MSYKAKNLPAEKHCFFGTEGGVSTGIYSSLNVNFTSDDKPENLQKNLEIVAGHFGLGKDDLMIINQNVSSHVEYVEQASFKEITADGVVTDKPNIALCIRTADCAPVLLADYENGIIGAAHAGWRGAIKGVIENTIDLMVAKGAVKENIAAAVGPCIGQKSYEVDAGFYQQFIEKNPAFAGYFKDGIKPDFYQFDLEGFCVGRLQAHGIMNITASGLDTYALKDDYFSFRRNTHLGIIHAYKCFPTEISTIVL